MHTYVPLSLYIGENTHIKMATKDQNKNKTKDQLKKEQEKAKKQAEKAKQKELANKEKEKAHKAKEAEKAKKQAEKEKAHKAKEAEKAKNTTKKDDKNTKSTDKKSKDSKNSKETKVVETVVVETTTVSAANKASNKSTKPVDTKQPSTDTNKKEGKRVRHMGRKTMVLITATVFAVAGAAVAIITPLALRNKNDENNNVYTNGQYYDDYYYAPPSAVEHFVASEMDENTNLPIEDAEVYGSSYYASNLYLNVDGTNDGFGESLFEYQNDLDTYTWVNPFVLATNNRYQDGIMETINGENIEANGYVTTGGEGSYSNAIVDLESTSLVSEYYYTITDENTGDLYWYTVDYVSQYEVDRKFDTNGDGVKDSGIEIVMDEALVAWDHYAGNNISYVDLSTVNLYIDGTEYDLLETDKLSTTDQDLVEQTIWEWTYWGPAGNPNVPDEDKDDIPDYTIPNIDDAKLSKAEGATALYAINASKLDMDKGSPVYNTNGMSEWYLLPSEDEDNDSVSQDDSLFNELLEQGDVLGHIKEVTDQA